jgi:hypothetical protein
MLRHVPISVVNKAWTPKAKAKAKAKGMNLHSSKAKAKYSKFGHLVQIRTRTKAKYNNSGVYSISSVLGGRN